MPHASLEFGGKKYLLNAISTKGVTKDTVEHEAKALRKNGFLARIIKFPLQKIDRWGKLVKSGEFEYCIYTRKR